jgi:predicted RNase H-like HicB family nuclease
MVARMKYRVVFEPDEGGGWHAYIPKVRGCRTWGRSLQAARRYIREALATCVDVLGDDAERIAREAQLEEAVKLRGAAKKALTEYRDARKRAAQLADLAQLRAGRAAAQLTRRAHLSLRDAGELLGVSHERVHQMVAEEDSRRAAPKKTKRQHSKQSKAHAA